MVDGYLNFNTKINTKGFSAGLQTIEKTFKGLQSSLRTIGGLIGVTFGVAGIAAFTKEAKALYRVQLEAETKLETVLGRNLGATREQIQATKDWASALQQVGVIGDEVQLSGLQELSTYIDNADALKRMNVVLNDMLAQQYGLEASAEQAVTIATMLGKVLDGQTGALMRYGYSFTSAQEQLLKYGTEEQRVATLAEVVEASVGGMNEALANTPAGRMKQLSNAFGDVKEQFGQAFTNIETLLIPALTRLVELLAAAAEHAVQLSESLAATFGIELTNSAAVTGNIAASIDEQDGLTEAVEETAKAQEMMLAGFDKITKLTSSEDSSSQTTSPEITPVISTSGLTASGSDAAEKVQEILDGLLALLDPFKVAWDSAGADMIASVQRTVENINALLLSIGGSFESVWENGTGAEIVETILRTFANISDTIGNLSLRFRIAWEMDDTGTQIIQNAADHLLILLDTIERCSKATADWAAGLDFSPLLQSFDGVQRSLTPIFEKLGGAFSWVWENVLLPFGKWTVEDALPASLDVLSGALDVLDSVLEALNPYGMWLWDEFIQPLANWTGEIIVTGLEDLAGVLHDIGDWITEHPDAAVTIGGLTAAFLGLYTVLSGGLVTAAITKLGSFIGTLATLDVTIGVIVAGIVAWGYVITELHANWDDIMDVLEQSGGVFGFISGWIEYCREDIEEFFDLGRFGHEWRLFWETVGETVYTYAEKIGGFFGKIRDKFTETIEKIKWWFNICKDYITEKIDTFPGYMNEKLTAAYDSTIKPFEKIGEWAYDRVEDIKRPFQAIADWFHDVFSEAWQRVLEVFDSGGTVFGGIEAGISSVFTQTVNGLIDGINNALVLPFWNIKEALRVLREWQFMDITPFYWMPDIDIPKIPRLAQGTVVPANYGEFLAVLGDNKREAEVVSPVSAMKQAMREVMGEFSGGEKQPIVLELDGKVFYKAMIRENNRSIRMTGKNPLETKGAGV